MAVPTWRSQAAPSFEAALGTIADSNKQRVLGLDKISKSIDEGSDAYGDIVKNEAYNTLSNITPEQGESRAAARQRTISENPGSFDSSFLGAKEMNNLEKTLGALDAGKKAVDDKSAIMNHIRDLSTLESPDKKIAMNEFATFTRNNNIKDTDNLLAPIADELLQQTQVQITPELIKKHGGDPNNERSLTPDVLKNIQQDIETQVTKNNRWASPKALKSAFKDIAARSGYKAMFDRMVKTESRKSTVDVELDKHAGLIADSLFKGTNEDLINALQNGAYYLYTNRNELTAEQAEIIEQPLIQAMEGLKINAFDVYTSEKVGGIKGKQATVSLQKKFRKEMQRQYKEKFKWLSDAVIDKKIVADIGNDDELGAIFQTGDMIAQFKTKAEREELEDALKHKKDDRKFLYDIARTGNTWSLVAKKLETKINKTLEGLPEAKDSKLRGDNLEKLYNQVRLSVQKLSKLFKKSDGSSTLTGDQKNTFDLALLKMFTSQGGMDINGNNYNPFDKSTFGLMGLEPGEDMSKLTADQLLEGLKEFLPQRSQRTTDNRTRDKDGKLSGELLETKINALLGNNKKVIEPTNEKTGTLVGYMNKIFPTPEKRRKIQETFVKEHGRSMIWYDPVTYGPWLLNKYKGSAEEKVIRSLMPWLDK